MFLKPPLVFHTTHNALYTFMFLVMFSNDVHSRKSTKITPNYMTQGWYFEGFILERQTVKEYCHDTTTVFFFLLFLIICLFQFFLFQLSFIITFFILILIPFIVWLYNRIKIDWFFCGWLWRQLPMVFQIWWSL